MTSSNSSLYETILGLSVDYVAILFGSFGTLASCAWFLRFSWLLFDNNKCLKRVFPFGVDIHRDIGVDLWFLHYNAMMAGWTFFLDRDGVTAITLCGGFLVLDMRQKRW